MARLSKNSSHHLLPLSSMIFKRTKSTQDLNSTTALSANRASTTTTTLQDIGEVPDNDITALPTTKAGPPYSPSTITLPLRRKVKSDSLNSAAPSPYAVATNESEVHILNPRLAQRKDRSKSKSTWKKLVGKVKKPFKGMKSKRRATYRKEDKTSAPISIGSPTDFKHEQTGGGMPLRGVGGAKMAESIMSQSDWEDEDVRP